MERQWNSLLSDLNADVDGEITASSIILFTQLIRVFQIKMFKLIFSFQENSIRLAFILRDASNVLSTDISLMQLPAKGGISTQLTHSLNVVLKLADCPFLFVTGQFVCIFK